MLVEAYFALCYGLSSSGSAHVLFMLFALLEIDLLADCYASITDVNPYGLHIDGMH